MPQTNQSLCCTSSFFPSIFPPLPSLKWLNIWVRGGKKRICYRIYKTYPLFSVRWNNIRLPRDRDKTKYLGKEADCLVCAPGKRGWYFYSVLLPRLCSQSPLTVPLFFVGRDTDSAHTWLSGGNGLGDKLKNKTCVYISCVWIRAATATAHLLTS